MTWLLALSLLVNVGVVWFFMRAQTAERDFWGALLAQETKDRATLLNRIQAPTTAIAQSMPEPSEEAPYVPVEDDERYWDNRAERGLVNRNGAAE